jgi:hypothetical protein
VCFLALFFLLSQQNPTKKTTQSAQQSWQLNWRWAGGAPVQVKAADGAVLISPGGGAGVGV